VQRVRRKKGIEIQRRYRAEGEKERGRRWMGMTGLARMSD
jgi:hypothetical protein